MKHETEHLIRVSPDESSQIEERRQSQASVSLRDKAAAYDLLHDAVEGNVFQRMGRVEHAIEDVREQYMTDRASNTYAAIKRLEREFELLELCLQRYASVLLQAQITNVAQRQAGEDVNRSPEAMRRCERTGEQ